LSSVAIHALRSLGRSNYPAVLRALTVFISISSWSRPPHLELWLTEAYQTALRPQSGDRCGKNLRYLLQLWKWRLQR
jgi:hypothetical protein